MRKELLHLHFDALLNEAHRILVASKDSACRVLYLLEGRMRRYRRNVRIAVHVQHRGAIGLQSPIPGWCNMFWIGLGGGYPDGADVDMQGCLGRRIADNQRTRQARE